MQFSHSTSYKQEVIAVWKNPEDLLINSSRKKEVLGPLRGKEISLKGWAAKASALAPELCMLQVPLSAANNTM